MLSHASLALNKASEIIVEYGGIIIKFTVVLLATTYSLYIIALLSMFIPIIGDFIALISTLTGYVVVIYAFTKTLRAIYMRALSGIRMIGKITIVELFLKLVIALLTAQSIILLLATLHTIVVEAGISIQVYNVVILLTTPATIVALIYLALRELRIIRERVKLYKLARRRRN